MFGSADKVQDFKNEQMLETTPTTRAHQGYMSSILPLIDARVLRCGLDPTKQALSQFPLRG